MEANLVRISNAHALIPERRYLTVHQVIVRRQMSGALVVRRSISAVMNQTPEVIGMKIASHEGKRLQGARSSREICNSTSAGRVPGLLAAICAAHV